MANKIQIAYVSHGGGPMPLLGDPQHLEMVATLRDITEKVSKQVGKPDAILVISAHWETRLPTITSSLTPKLIYDYSGFPSQAYQIQYPCSGDPELARQVYEVLSAAGIESEQDPHRGLDHGAFVPMKLMYPNADVPCVQLSLTRGLDADFHLSIGKALQSIEYNNVLVIGSGMSFHNLPAFFSLKGAGVDIKNQAFEQWLTSTMTSINISEAQRRQLLRTWQNAPHARYCHPREEHLIPLHVCYGIAQRPSDSAYSVEIMGKQSSMFLWQ